MSDMIQKNETGGKFMLNLRKPLVIVLVAIASALVSACAAATAFAAPTIELTRGTAEPVESITTQLGGVVTNGGGGRFFMHVKPSGGEACGANASADHGENVFDENLTTESNPVVLSRNWTFRAAGAYRLCAWVTKDFAGSEVEAFTEVSFSVRVPHLALSISVPATVVPQQTFQVSTTGQAETERPVWEYIVPSTGDGCPANADAADRTAGEREVLGFWSITGGPLTETRNQSLSTPGGYLVCAYFEYPSRESAPELSASAQTTVVAPPPPCLVPTFRRGARLASVVQTIRAGGCSVGKIHYSSSSSVARGGVIGLSPVSGTKLAPGAAVSIVVSAGKPCVVPVIRRGATLSKAERLLTSASCRATVFLVHSHRVRRGHVIRLGSRAHARLFPLSRIKVVVSAGP
jgi:hypothetical protein